MIKIFTRQIAEQKDVIEAIVELMKAINADREYFTKEIERIEKLVADFKREYESKFKKFQIAVAAKIDGCKVAEAK